MSLDVLVSLWMRGLLLTAALWLGLRLGPRLRAATRYWLCALTLVLVASDTALELARILRVPAAAPSVRPISFIWLRLSPGWTLVCTAIWAAATLVMWLRMATARSRVERFKGRTSPFPRARLEALPLFARARREPVRPARIRLSTDVTEASIFGGRHPVIAVAPEFADRLDDIDLDWVLARAQCHLDRRDHWAEPFRRVLVALCWFHPAAWILSGMLRVEHDAACDERVAHLMSGGESPRHPSRMLVLSHCSAVATVLLIVGVVSHMDPRVFMADREVNDRQAPAAFAELTPVITADAALPTPSNPPALMPSTTPDSEASSAQGDPAPPQVDAPSADATVPPAMVLAALAPESLAPLTDATTLIELTAPPAAMAAIPDATTPSASVPATVNAGPLNQSKGLASHIAHAGVATGSAVGHAGVATAGAVVAAGKSTASFFKWIGGAITKIGG